MRGFDCERRFALGELRLISKKSQPPVHQVQSISAPYNGFPKSAIWYGYFAVPLCGFWKSIGFRTVLGGIFGYEMSVCELILSDPTFLPPMASSEIARGLEFTRKRASAV